MSQDLYKILNVSQSATREQIKKAYRDLAKKYHPDRNSGNKEAEQKFKEISGAYDILGDEKKRAQYDQQRAGGFVSGAGAGSAFDEGFSFYGMNTGGMNDFFHNIFEEMFGGGASSPSQRSTAQPGQTISYTLGLTLEEAFSGFETKAKFPTCVVCSGCKGKGFEEGGHIATCSQCHGHGINMRTHNVCSKCRGQGFFIEKPCGKCKGEGRVKDYKEVFVKVPIGVDENNVLLLSKQGEAGIRGGAPGDLHVHIKIKPHKIFKRDGINLFCSYPLCVVDAALGTTIEVPTIEGKKVSVPVPAGTQNGDRLRVVGRGMTVQGRARGDLHVTIEAYVPVDLTQEQKELFKNFKEKDANKSPKARGLFSSIIEFFKKFSSGTES